MRGLNRTKIRAVPEVINLNRPRRERKSQRDHEYERPLKMAENYSKL